MNLSEKTRLEPSSVYAIQCIKTGRIYVGCTTNVQSRLASHYRELKGGWKTMHIPGNPERVNSVWQEDFDKYGEDGFQNFLIEEGICWEDRRKREAFYIEKYHSSDPRYGYNARTERERSLANIIKGEPNPRCPSKEDA